MRDRRDVTLNNVMFPIWMLWLFPMTWLIVLPANLAIDLLVLLIAMRCMGVANIKQNALRAIVRVWLMGFVADFVGTALMFAATLPSFDGAFGEWWYHNIANAVSFNPFKNGYALLYATLCIAVSALCIYWFNRRFCLKKTELDDRQKQRLSLVLAIATAPYLFYFPSALIY